MGQVMVQWRAVMSMIINRAIHKNEKFLLASKEPSSMETDISSRFLLSSD